MARKPATAKTAAADTNAPVVADDNKPADNAADTSAPSNSPAGGGDDAADTSAPEGGDVLESATHDAIVTIAEGDDGSALRDHVEGDTFKVAVTAYAGKPMTFSAAWGEFSAENKANNSDRFATFQSAIQAAIRAGFPSYKSKMVSDIAYTPPMIGDNAPEIRPWEADAADAGVREALVAKGQHAAELVANIIGGRKRERVDYMALAADLVAANDLVASWSLTARGDKAKASTAAWSEYVTAFFPAIMDLGKNTVSEAVTLGRAPEAVLARWPENQTSPKSFQNWSLGARKTFVHAARNVIAPADPLIDWNAATADNPDLPKPAKPTYAVIRERLVAGDVQAALSDAIDAKNATIAKLMQEKPRPTAAIREAEGQIVAWRDAIAVGDWLVGDLPALTEGDADVCPFKRAPLVKALVTAINDRWAEYAGYAADDAKRAKERAAIVEASDKLFADLDPADAITRLFNMVKGHADAALIVQGLVDRLAETEASAGAADDADAAAGDADLDPGAGEAPGDDADDDADE